MSIYSLFETGGLVMWALLALSIAAVATAAERSVVLARAQRGVAGLLSDLKRTLLQKRAPEKARQLCRPERGPVARLAAAGLARLNGSSRQLEATLERQAQKELRKLGRGLRILATVAVTAPLLGFLGTVTGMIAAFDALVKAASANPALVADGIREALTTTAAGLVVAVPAQLLYSYLSSRLDKLTGYLEEAANLLLEVREDLV